MDPDDKPPEPPQESKPRKTGTATARVFTAGVITAVIGWLVRAVGEGQADAQREFAEILGQPTPATPAALVVGEVMVAIGVVLAVVGVIMWITRSIVG